MNKVHRSIIILFMVCMAFVAAKADTGTVVVHAYSPLAVGGKGFSGKPFPSHVKSDALSSRYAVKVSGTEVAAVKYDNTYLDSRWHNMDVSRFATNSKEPVIEITLIDGDTIDSVAVHPMRYYPQSAIKVSADKKCLTFALNQTLPYAIVAINGTDPEDSSDANPQLALINDPLESDESSELMTGANVLNFGEFAKRYLKEHPIKDRVGAVCRNAGKITDYSLNDDKEYSWSYNKGHYVEYDQKVATFPDMRARNSNDVSEALQAALQEIKSQSQLNTLYIPAGVYLWSGLRIENWNGDASKGGKPLYIYTDENALMVNRMKECREANEPAIFIYNSSHVTISGRGIYDGQGCQTYSIDRKDARNTPHQGGVVVRNSSEIIFHDTYSRNSQQWNYETHNVENVTFRNIKGLSPYFHAWVDGLNIASGKNVTVDGAITLGNDDTFATGHYNPSDEFPARTYRETKGINLENTDDNSAEIRHTFAAAGFYNKDRLQWSPNDTENIRISNTLGWTRTAHCIRISLNTRKHDLPTDSIGRKLDGFFFDNFNSVVGSKADGDIRIIGFDESRLTPCYKSIEIHNSSFFKPSDKWAKVETKVYGNDLIETLLMDSLYYSKPMNQPEANFTGVSSLLLKNIFITY